jgi:hypothetical protein
MQTNTDKCKNKPISLHLLTHNKPLTKALISILEMLERDIQDTGNQFEQQVVIIRYGFYEYSIWS